ncbi:N-acetyltransferase [Corynebacterium bovis]|uniref:N-acetyltransferase n=2 Tax=Corynebacterium bovis TaxID=36808 RepID=A0A3R8PLG8_9CORY|nr:N-acetyltransferase [Corynebacterium bovis]RRO97480.1 N-acetyltransferase [Corynebacterium bovis]RRO99284.1 N-acetyltransferase [Corynebacterium bovis]RRQ02332.1 N-acetyltransferase [Corynebacterium bovis]RRQ02496.1 N-acetyltransferase [Corynebacterium bovis]
MTVTGTGTADSTDTATADRRRGFSVRRMTEADHPRVREIHQEGIDTGHATYEREAPDWENFMANRWMHLAFVAEDDRSGRVIGWTAASRASHRDVFSGVVEDSIYVAGDAAGRGVAGALLDTLLAAAAEKGCWVMHSSIFPENEGSLRLHRSRGFREIGVAHVMSHMEYGPMAGRWRDIVLMEKVLEDGPAFAEYAERVGTATS